MKYLSAPADILRTKLTPVSYLLGLMSGIILMMILDTLALNLMQ